MITKDELVKEENNRSSSVNELKKKGWFKPVSAAKYADVSVTTIYKWMKDPVHPLRSVKRNGRLISKKRLDEYLDQFEQNRMF